MINELKTQKDLIEAFKEYNRSVYNYIYFKAYNNKEIAEDLTQDVFIKAWENREKFNKKKANLKTWLIAIARNHTIDFFRNSKNKLSNNIIIDNDEIIDNSTALENSVNTDFIKKKLNLLTEVERDMLIMRYINQIEIEEIGFMYDKTYEATKVAIHRALKKLKDLVNKN
jgi:RNA polymerase sigma-70 factor (ECF subfamily)